MVTIATILLGKIIFYWFATLVEKISKYVNQKSENKKHLESILEQLSNNRAFISDVSKMVDPKRGIDTTTAGKIVKMQMVQSTIDRQLGKDGNKKEIETELKNIFFKAWSDSSTMNQVISKVKNDVK